MIITFRKVALLLVMCCSAQVTLAQLPRCSALTPPVVVNSTTTPTGPVVCQANKAQGTPLLVGAVAQLAYNAGFRCSALVSAIAVVNAESGYDPQLEDYNVTRNGGIRSTDRGLWQLNTKIWPVCAANDACALNAVNATQYAARLYTLNGNTFNWWLATQGSNYSAAIPAAQQAAKQFNGPCAPPCTGGVCPGLPGLNGGHGEEIVTSNDPNDKVGSQGAGITHFLTSLEPLRYAIYFDNQPTASVAAQTVVVTDQLDKARVDVTGLVLGPISFVTHLVTPPSIPLSLGTFTADVDLRPAQNLIARVSADLNVNTGVLTWKFQSIDPATNQPTTDPLAGFLPPGTEGSVAFTLRSQPNISTGTAIRNQATVVFDVNAPLNTPVWSNTLDNDKPTSHVLALPSTVPLSFGVQWSGADVGSGVANFTVYASDNGGPYAPWLTGTTDSLSTYAGVAGHTYSFYSIARDLVGNVEISKSVAEATTTITLPPTVQCTGCYFLISGVRATLAFNVASVGGGSTFTYNYRTSTQTVQFVSTTTAQIGVNGSTATFSGQGKLNGQTGYSFAVTAKDGGGVGSSLDTVSIAITGPNNYSYSVNGTIAGGDIVVKQ